MFDLEQLKKDNQAPEWLTEDGFKMLSNGYLQNNETPRQMYERVAKAASSILNRPDLEQKFFDYTYGQLIALSTPVAANLGIPGNGLSVSCFGGVVEDSTIGIFESLTENCMLCKYGGGVSTSFDRIRPTGAPIKGGGQSGGIVPWLKVMEAGIKETSQGGARRGSICCWLDVYKEVNGEEVFHPDLIDFLYVRDPSGDPNRRCLSESFHHGVVIPDRFMEAVDNPLHPKHDEHLEMFLLILEKRQDTGEPFILFIDAVNNNRPPAYVNNELYVKASNLCSEITLFSSTDHTFTCVLSSLVLSNWEKIKNSDCIEVAIYLLDAVAEDFIRKSEGLPGTENARRSTIKGRALGLGALGFHTLLQDKMIALDSREAFELNAEIFRTIKQRAEAASRELAKEYGEPEWCKGTGMRNTHLTAIAPNVSSSIIAGNVSQSIEPIAFNCYINQSAKGTFIKKNVNLEKILDSKGKNTFDTWKQIRDDNGSVKSLSFLSDHEKDVFKTAREVNQYTLVRLNSQRTKFISQAVSFNIFFSIPKDLSIKEDFDKMGEYIFGVHMEAWKLGVRSMYYMRAETALKIENVFSASDCRACEG